MTVEYDEGSVDLTSLWQMIGVNEKDTMCSFIDSYLDSADERLRTMYQAIATQDFYRLELEAHTLKSSSRNFGANTLSSYCQMLEGDAKTGLMMVITPHLELVAHEYHRVKTALEQIRLTLRSS